MRGLLLVLIVIACSAMLTEGARAELSQGPAAPGKPAVEEAAPPPATHGDRSKRVGDEPAPPPIRDGDLANGPQSQAEKTATAEVNGLTGSICLTLESAARANGLPLEFFARVIWQESRFQPSTVGLMTRSGHRAQGIAQIMPDTAARRGLLDPFNPEIALPKAAEFLAELRSELGNLGLAAAAYNAGPGRVHEFIDRRGGLPAQTRNYVRAITGRSVEDWAALGREGGKDGIAKATSCRQLAALPSFFIGKVKRKVREAALRPHGIPDWPNASRSVTAPNRNPLQAELPTSQVPIPKPNPSAASGDLKRLSSTPESGKSIPAAGLRATSAASMASLSTPALGRLRAFSPDETPRDHAARRVAARPTGNLALVRDPKTQARAGLLPTPELPTPKPRPPAAWAKLGVPSATPVKSTAGALRATSVESRSSTSKQASNRVRERSPEEMIKAADERIKKLMMICRGC